MELQVEDAATCELCLCSAHWSCPGSEEWRHSFVLGPAGTPHLSRVLWVLLTSHLCSHTFGWDWDIRLEISPARWENVAEQSSQPLCCPCTAFHRFQEGSRRVPGVQGHVGQSSPTLGIPGVVWLGEEVLWSWAALCRVGQGKAWLIMDCSWSGQERHSETKQGRVGLWEPATLPASLLQCDLFVISGFPLGWWLSQVNAGLGFGLQSDDIQKKKISKDTHIFLKSQTELQMARQFGYRRQTTTNKVEYQIILENLSSQAH